MGKVAEHPSGMNSFLSYPRLMQVLPAVYLCDAQGRVRQYNEAAVALWGRAPVLGHDQWCGSVRIYRPDGSPMALEECPMAVALREGRTIVGEEIIIERPDGTRRNVLPHPRPLFSDSGTLIGAVNVLIDITPHRKAQADLAAATLSLAGALEESERRFERFMENLPGAAWIKDTNGRYVYVNAEAGRIFPVTADQIRGKTDYDVFPEATADQFKENDRRVLATGQPVQVIELLPDANGVVHHSIVSKFPLPGSDGRPAFVGGVAFDITDQVRAEQALRDTEARFRTLAMNAPVSIFMKDLSGRYTLANPPACKALGRPEGAEGLSDHDLLPTDIADALRRQDLRVLTGSTALAADEYVGSEGHEVRKFLSVKFPLADGQGNPVGIGGVAIDVTDRDRAVEAQREAAALLEGCIDALTSHIAILDQNGVIIKVNEAWRRFGAQNGYTHASFGVGTNYLEACTRHTGASGGDALEAQYAAEGVRSVLQGERPLFVAEYPCHSPTERRWFTMRVTRFGDGAQRRVVVAHEDVTDRHEAEKLIIENVERLRLATAAANLGTWDLDPRTGRVTCDTRAAELLGLERGAGGTDFDALMNAVHPDDRPRVREEIARALDPAGSGTYEGEHRVKGIHDNIERWLRVNAQATFDKGRATQVIGTLKDITAAKQAEEALRRSEEMMRLATDASGVGTWTKDVATNSVRWSPKLEEIFGLERGTFPGRESDFYELVHPDDRERLSAVVRQAIAEGTEYEVEFRYRHASGTYRWMVGRGRAWYDPSGRPTLLAGTGEDITARKEAEAALKHREELFRTLANSIPQLAWMARPDGYFEWYNHRWYAYTGSTPETMDGWGWQAVHDPAELPRVMERFKTALARGEAWEDTFTLRRHDGEMRWHLSRALPIRDEHGRIVRWFGTNTDITEQRRAEEMLARQQSVLEEAVRARTAELEESNDRLRLAERMAALGTLSAGLGHDMGNLLVPIRIRLKSLAGSGVGPDAMEDVEAIRTSVEYLQRLANGLRMLSLDPERAVAGESTELLKWWEDASALLRNILPRGVELKSKLPDRSCSVAMSRAALTQAVFNLVQNAGEALRPRGKGTVAVEIEAQGDWIVLSVSDDGPGMTPEVKRRCMEPFFTTKTRDISTGLGLLLVYGLVREAGGEVELQSELGVGTRFVLRIRNAAAAKAHKAPAVCAEVKVTDAHMRAIVASELRAMSVSIAPAGADGAGPMILVTDDAAAAQAGPEYRGVVLLTDLAEEAPGVVALGRRPKLQTIREALRRLCSGVA